jgi:uncharacterized protein involved in exopolysaccharide biosynthesis
MISTAEAPAPEREDELSLPQLTAVLWGGRWLIFSITLLTTALAGIAAVVLPKQYQATVIISAASNSGSSSQLGALSSMASQFSGLASLAGINVPGDSKKAESLAVLQSEALTESYIDKNDLLPVLYQKRWDPMKKTWKISNPQKVPTLWKANQYFKTHVRSLVTDTKTGLSTLTITWKDPKLAAKWANDLVRMTNDFLRDQAIRESERNIAYLNEQATKTDLLGARQAIFTILQSEINKVMMARGNDEYALKVLDPAFAPELASSPKLALWLAIGFVGGLILAIFAVIVRNEWRNG